jgi:hypothetical protein
LSRKASGDRREVFSCFFGKRKNPAKPCGCKAEGFSKGVFSEKIKIKFSAKIKTQTFRKNLEKKIPQSLAAVRKNAIKTLREKTRKNLLEKMPINPCGSRAKSLFLERKSKNEKPIPLIYRALFISALYIG